MKKILLSVAMLCMALGGRALADNVCEGWRADYDGVMLQAFWWDGYEDAKWTNLESKADELSQYFNLIWVPNSGTVTSNPKATTQGTSMGYDPCFWLSHNSCFGTEAELRSMINTFKLKGVGIIEDVVINHKKGQTSWLDFPDEEVTVGNETYTIDWNGAPEDYITCNDDCNYQGYATHGNYDTGDDFPGFRDLDHTKDLTQNNIITYLKFLKNELGYVGFRYDLVKGYAPGFIKDYNDAAMPEFSVGEYWDDQTSIQNWIMNTGNRSAAFDFPLKYKINQAISNGDYSAFDWKSFAFDPNFSQYAVTFVDNHDTGREDHSKLVNNWSAANAFILASPGTPCIWYKHYLADASNIQKMIMARKACGITNTYCIVEEQYPVNNTGYILKTVGHKGSLYLQLGTAVGDTPYGYQFVCGGDSYKLYSSINDFASVTVSPNGGNFTTSSQKVTFTVMNAIENGASYKVGDGETWTPITEDHIYIGDNVEYNTDIPVYWRATGSDGVPHSGSVTFTKRASYPKPIVENNDEVSVFFETDQKDVKIWAWRDNVNYTGDAWVNKPSMTPMGVNSAGKLVYKWTYDGNLTDAPAKVLFIDGSNQTPDFDFVNHGYYTAKGLDYKLEENTVYFDNSVSGWNNVYYYAWTKNGECEHEWPGVALEARADGKYEVSELDGIYTSIIFNDPYATGVKQTEDLTVVDGKTYSLEANTVYFDNSQVKWDKVYYYAYTKDESPKEKWPGEVVTTTDDRGFFKVTLLDAYTTVIFNDGTTNGSQVGVNQTENLAVEDEKVYTIDVAMVNSVIFANSLNDWSNPITMEQKTGEENTWSCSFDLTNVTNNVEFKLLVNEKQWLGYNEVSLSVPKYTWVSGNSGSNITLNNYTTNYKTYRITATWTPSASAKQGWTVKIEGVEPRDPLMTLTVAGTEALLGSPWNAADESNDMTFCEDGTCYYLTKMVYLAAGDYEFKVVKDHDWEHGSYGDQHGNNYNFNVGSPGLYEVSFYYHQTDNHLSHNVVLKDVLEIVDGEPFEAGGNFTNNSTVAIASYHRAFKNNWGTLCLPFAITKKYPGVKFYQLGAVDTGNKVLTFEETASVEAGQPVVYKAEDGVDLNFTEVDVAVSATTSTVIKDDWTLNGTFKALNEYNPSSGLLYFIASNQFWQGEDTNIAAYRAYYTTTVDLGDVNPKAPYRISIGEEGQDIKLVESKDGTVKLYYDLQGRRLGEAQKGLVIENGKLIFVK